MSQESSSRKLWYLTGERRPIEASRLKSRPADVTHFVYEGDEVWRPIAELGAPGAATAAGTPERAGKAGARKP